MIKAKRISRRGGSYTRMDVTVEKVKRKIVFRVDEPLPPRARYIIEISVEDFPALMGTMVTILQETCHECSFDTTGHIVCPSCNAVQ